MKSVNMKICNYCGFISKSFDPNWSLLYPDLCNKCDLKALVEDMESNGAWWGSGGKWTGHRS